MSKVVKGVFKGAKKLLKGVGKAIKKIVKSDLFKVAAAGALIYFGGSALGAWGGGGGAATAGTATGTTTAGAGTATAGTAGTGTAGTAASGAGATTTGAAASAAKTGSVLGKLGKVAKGVGGFVKNNPMASAMIMNAVGSAVSPDEIDIMREQEEIRRNRWRNMEVPDDIGLNTTQAPLTYSDGRLVHGNNMLNRGMRNA